MNLRSGCPCADSLVEVRIRTCDVWKLDMGGARPQGAFDIAAGVAYIYLNSPLIAEEENLSLPLKPVVEGQSIESSPLPAGLPEGRGPTLRAVGAGLAVIALINVWVAWSEYIIHASRMNLSHFPLAFYVLFLGVILAGRALGRIYPRRRAGRTSGPSWSWSCGGSTWDAGVSGTRAGRPSVSGPEWMTGRRRCPAGPLSSAFCSGLSF
jgi:hypothetical protein